MTVQIDNANWQKVIVLDCDNQLVRTKEHLFILWHGGTVAVVRTSELQPRGHRFESQPLSSTCNPGQVVHTHVPPFTKQYKLVPAYFDLKSSIRGINDIVLMADIIRVTSIKILGVTIMNGLSALSI